MKTLPAALRRTAIEPDLNLYRDDWNCSIAIRNLGSPSPSSTRQQVIHAMLLSGGTVAVCAASYFAYLVAG